MQRRWALAAALALTTIVTFALVLVGARGGLFGEGDTGPAAATTQEPSPEEIALALQELASAGVPPAAEEQRVITEYVYVEEPPPPPSVRYITQPAPTSAAPALAPTALPAPTEVLDAPTEVPLSTPASPTAPAAPSATPRPAQSGPLDEDEFTGTVTAINGDLVTFAHGGSETVVRVTSGMADLHVGTVAQVHALLLSSGWIAKEIEIEGD
jgi:hypothetical protein